MSTCPREARSQKRLCRTGQWGRPTQLVGFGCLIVLAVSLVLSESKSLKAQAKSPPPALLDQPSRPVADTADKGNLLHAVQAKTEPEKFPTLPPPPKVKPPDARADLLLSAARNAVTRGALPEATARFEEYLKLFPADGEVRREYAGLLQQMDRVNAAVEQYKSLLAGEPHNTSLLIPLADAYLQLGNFRKASALLAQAVERAPGNLDYAIRLTRSYAFAGEFTKAFQAFDRHLGRLKPNEARVPKTYGVMLIDLGLPEDAIDFLQPLRTKFPDDLDILAYLIRAHARLGQRSRTLRLIDDLAARKPGTIPVRLELAKSLYQASDLEAAELIFRQILHADSSNAAAQIGLARVHIQLFQPREALRFLHAVDPPSNLKRIDRLTWAEYHQLVGEYSQAKRIYRTLLDKDADDGEARLALAKLYEFIREDEKAKAEYAKVPDDSNEHRAARLGIVGTLMTERRFAEAVELGRLTVRETGNHPSALATLARVLAKAGAVAEATGICLEYLRAEKRNEAGIVEVRLILGKILLDEGHLAEAAVEFAAALNRPSGRVAAAFYGLACVRLKLGALDEGRLMVDMAAGVLGESRGPLLLADLFVGDVDDATAGDLCQVVLRYDANNLAALIRLADIRQRQSIRTAHIEEVMTLGEVILRQSPQNVRAFLVMARAASIARQFDKSVETYNRLIWSDPEFLVPQRERARVLYSDHAFRASRAAYADIRNAALLGMPSISPAVASAEQKLAVLGMPRASPAVASPEAKRLTDLDIAKPMESSLEPDSRLANERAYHDAVARAAEARGAELEGRGKALKGWRDYASIPAYQQLFAHEPANTEGLFDLGQVYSTLKRTNQAIPTYAELLNVDPRHRDAAIAIDRARMELQPQWLLNEDLFSERGRNGLASIDRYRSASALRVPFGDEIEYVQVGYARVRYNPVGAAGVDGDIPSVRAQKRAFDRVLLYGQANLEMFEAGAFHNRVTFDTGVRYEPCDLMRLSFSAYRENVAEDAGSLVQDIHQEGIRVGGDIRPSRRWDFGGNYRYAAYSDNNSANEVFLFNEVLLTFLPRQLKLVTRVDCQAFAHPSQFPPNYSGDGVNVVHPYFAPTRFAYVEQRIEWLHYLSRDYFAHANVCWYSLQYGMGLDNSSNRYHTFRALFNYDICSWASLGVDSTFTLSQVYTNAAASAYLVLRLPRLQR